MNGMEMLLQSFGVNTEEVKANVDSAVQLVRLMNEQLAHLKEVADRIEAKQGQQAGTLATIQAKATDLEAQLILMNEWQRREDWPPQVTQTLEMQEFPPGSGKFTWPPRKENTDNAGRTEGTAKGINGRRTDADRG